MWCGAAGAVLVWLIVVTTLSVAPASAQGNAITRRDTFWFGAGLGVGSEDFGGNLNASYQFGHSVISLRTGGTAGLFDDGFSDYALLYGRATSPAGQRYHAGAGVGIGLVNGCQGDGALGGCRDASTVVGLPLEVQVSWRPGNLLALALYGFANFNATRSFAGVTLGLQLGRLH